jgi:ubiquinone/menaquinone biosynthesis C-methylase UbiE/glycosyltransferase involved in cell wall biosynthesis
MRVVYVDPQGLIGTLDEPRLDETTERHLIALPPPAVTSGDPIEALRRESASGTVVALGAGCPSPWQMRTVRRALALGRRAWLFWPEEGAVECVTTERLSSHWRHWLVRQFFRFVADPMMRISAIPRRVSWALHGLPPREMPRFLAKRVGRAIRERINPEANPDGSGGPTVAPMVRHAQRLGKLREARQTAKAVPFPALRQLPDGMHRIPGCGVYLRTDFWSPIVSGGSYGHTCYVAKELAAVTESFTCFMANQFPLLDEYGLRQVVMPRPGVTNNEDDIAAATAHYVELLRPAFAELRPAYIYERSCIGNSAGALLSAEFSIPYILEYNGSEISMRRSFEGTGYLYEAEYLEAEALAFEQATLISVVSAEIRTSLVARGVSPSKILVNPNGVDLDAYAPAPPQEREAIRSSLGFSASDRVVGFTGTFGGWHGIDVLAEAIPQICRAAPSAKFLLIGDGHFKHLVDRAVQSNALGPRVVSTGRVPQVEGARLLKACDIYVSPHSVHMIDSKFFGSPTKIFEYMALGGGIVASDLEQIGQVLSPALTPVEAEAGTAVTMQRSVLCTPGNVSEFVQGVVALCQHAEMAAALGCNAHAAARDYYSWARHVAKLWLFLAGDAVAADISPDLRKKRSDAGDLSTRPSGNLIPPQHVVDTGDQYKDQVQRQWNNDPAGSHYVSEAPKHTKEWFLEAERHRYDAYAPWMRQTMEFNRHAGKDVLEIGGGMGTDLAQFALNGARVTDADLSAGHLRLAKENFAVRGLTGEFVQQDAESLVFPDDSFDVIYSNGVLHHTPNTQRVVNEIFRILRPGGRVIVMMYAEDSLHYWRNLVWNIGLKEGQLRRYSTGEIMSRTVERSDNAAAHPLVKVYTKERLRTLFNDFVDIEIVQRQLEPEGVPRVIGYVPRRYLAKIMGWNLVLKANKPR